MARIRNINQQPASNNIPTHTTQNNCEMFVRVGKYLYDPETDTQQFVPLPGIIALDPALINKISGSDSYKRLLLRERSLQRSVLKSTEDFLPGEKMILEEFQVQVFRTGEDIESMYEDEEIEIKLSPIVVAA